MMNIKTVPLNQIGTYLILLVILVTFALFSPQFFTVNNLLTLALQTSLVALAAIGMTFTIITGGIDLSVGSTAALAGAIAAGIAVQLGTYPGLLAGIATGLGVGALNGALIVWGRLPPFVATLASMATARGLTLVYTQGRPIAGLDQAFTFWGSESWIGVPMPVWILLITAVIAHLILRQTRLGLHLYAIGGSEETARLAGVNIGRIKFSAYLISGFCAALSGIMLTARLWSAQPNTGIGLELDAIAAAVLGGSSLAGGTGGIPGTIAGSFIIGMLANGLNLLGVPSYHQQVIKGAIFVIAVVLTGGWEWRSRNEPKVGLLAPHGNKKI